MNRGECKVFKFDPNTGGFSEENVRLVASAKNQARPKSLLSYGGNIFDMILFVFTCRLHQRILLRQLDRRNFFLPFFPLKLGESWTEACQTRLKQITDIVNINGSPMNMSRMEIIRINQVKIPKFAEIVIQLCIKTEMLKCSGQCQSDLNIFKWFNIADITVGDFFGPEVYLLSQESDSRAKLTELSVWNELKRYAKKWYICLETGFSEKQVSELFETFVQHNYPSMFMNRNQYLSYLKQNKINLSINSLQMDQTRMFQTFCLTNFEYIAFKDFVMTLVAIDPKCSHGAGGGELRARCMFRFYCQVGQQTMIFDDLLRLYQDIEEANKHTSQIEEKYSSQSQTDEQITTVEALVKVRKLFESNHYPINHLMTMDQFIELVGKLKIRGTSKLLRLPRSFLDQLDRIYKPLILQDHHHHDRPPDSTGASSPTTKQCSRCSRPTYSVEPEPLVVRFVPTFDSIEKEIHTRGTKSDSNKTKPTPTTTATATSTTIHHYMHKVLSRFSRLKYGYPRMGKGDPEMIAHWENEDQRLMLVDNIQKICSEVQQQFKSSTRVLKLQSPMYVFGDLHGNFKDLMIYDHLFWQMAPYQVGVRSLFLGDYVDRGDNSVECILYLFCLRLMAPSKFHMLRGNHESRTVQRHFTFYRECLEKFKKHGETIWESINQVFDVMPLCAIIDEDIYCAHGGIPTHGSRLENFYSITVPLTNPDQNQLAWEILWNDPVSRNEWMEFQQTFNVEDFFPDFPRGFLPNVKRGTAFYYAEEAVDSFMEQNNLSYVIRAHEVIPAGFQFHLDGKLITIFSCSNYCGASNESAIAYIHESKIRIIKIDTKNTRKKHSV